MTVKGNQGLDALASLCDEQSEVSTHTVEKPAASVASEMSPGGSTSHHGADGNNADSLGQSSSSKATSASQNGAARQAQHISSPLTTLQSGGLSSVLSSPSVFLNANSLSSQLFGNNNLMNLQQQLAFQQLLQAQARAQASARHVAAAPYGEINQQAILMALAGAQAKSFNPAQVSHVISAAQPQSNSTLPRPPISGSVALKNFNQEGYQKMPPTVPNVSGNSLGESMRNLGPSPSADWQSVDKGSDVDDKRQHKRAANRKSAQQSRKRKKQFIEELMEENDELRRKERILRSIPDLIVVFNSSGKLCFVSPSFSEFLGVSAKELEGTSFWDRLCEDSVRLLKTAFMDSLAARKPGYDTIPLGNGVWELQLLDQNSTYSTVTLNGVVHFSGDTPECVCSIRPSDTHPIQVVAKNQKVNGPDKPSRRSHNSGSSRSQYPAGIIAAPRQFPSSSNSFYTTVSDDVSGEESSSKEPSEGRRSPKQLEECDAPEV